MLLLLASAYALHPTPPGAPCATLELRRAHALGSPPALEPTPHAAEVGLDTEHFHIEGAGGLSPTEEELALLGAIFEEVWAHEIGTMGYREPALPESGKFPVYLEEMSPGLYGYTDLTRQDLPYIAINANMGWSGSSTEDAWKVTAAHEYFHAVQFAYDYWEASWWMEATAVWMEDQVYDDLDDYLYYMSDDLWPDYPEISMVAENGWHEYGEGVWPRYLDELHGGPAGIQQIWESCESGDALPAITDFLGGDAGFEAALLDFSARIALGYAGMDEGDQWWPVYRTDLVSDASGLPVTVEPTEFRPDYLGVNYFRIPLPESEPHELVVAFEGDPAEDGSRMRWQVGLVGTDGAEWSTEVAYTRSTTEVRLPDVGTRWHEAWVIVGILTEKTGVNHDAYDSNPRYDKAPPTFRFTASLADPSSDAGDTGDTGDTAGTEDTAGDGRRPPADEAEDCGCQHGPAWPGAAVGAAAVALIRRRLRG